MSSLSLRTCTYTCTAVKCVSVCYRGRHIQRVPRPDVRAENPHPYRTSSQRRQPAGSLHEARRWVLIEASLVYSFPFCVLSDFLLYESEWWSLTSIPDLITPRLQTLTYLCLFEVTAIYFPFPLICLTPLIKSASRCPPWSCNVKLWVLWSVSLWSWSSLLCRPTDGDCGVL